MTNINTIIDYSLYIKNIKRDNNLTNKELADQLGVTYHSVQAWCTNRRSPSKAILEKINALYNQKKIDREDDYIMKRDHQEMLIEFQKEKIISLENQLVNVKSTTRNQAFENFEADYETEIQIGFNNRKLTRCFTKMTNKKLVYDLLGFSEKELDGFFRWNETYEMYSHPVEKIIVHGNNNEIREFSAKVTSLLSNIKNIFAGEFIFTIPMSLKNPKNKNKIHIQTHNKINFFNFRIQSKIEIIRD